MDSTDARRVPFRRLRGHRSFARVRLIGAALLTLSGCNDIPQKGTGDDWSGPEGRFVEIFRDDFEGPAGSAPNPEHWNLEVVARSQNQELQYYTDRRDNSYLDGEGSLVIQALEESYESASYTSGRLNTQGRIELQYGRVEARIRLVAGKGLWPAFWMLGADFPQVPWPRSGEIDILELGGSRPHAVSGSLHGPDYSGSAALTRIYELPEGTFADAFHVFAFEWTSEGMRWLIDGEVYHTRTKRGLEELGKTWVFDKPFFILLNLAIGGFYDGDPDASTPFPSQMLVDYVSVSQFEAD